MKVLERINTALGVIGIEVPVVNQGVEGLLLKRKYDRKDMDLKSADRLRQGLKEMGIEITDSKEGSIWSEIK